MAPPFSLQNMAAPFKRIPTNILGAPGLDDPRAAGALQGFSQGFLRGDQTFADALTRGIAGGFGGLAAGHQFQQQQKAAAQQQALENAQAQAEADRKAAADAEKIRQFGITSGRQERAEQRLGQSAAAQQAIAKGNLAVGQGNLALRGKEFERGPVDPLVEVFDNTSPTGSTLMPRSQAAGQAGVGSFAGSGLTPGKAEELTASAGGLRLAQSKLQALRDDISDNPQRAGAVGSVNKALQTAGGIARDVAEVIPGVGGIADSLLGPAIATESQDVQDFLSDPSLEANQAAANSLAYALALSRKQGKRVTVQDVSTARDDLKITGLKSSKQVVARMDELLREIDQGIGLIEQRVSTGAPGASPQQAPSAALVTQDQLGTMSMDQLMQLRAGVAGNP